MPTAPPPTRRYRTPDRVHVGSVTVPVYRTTWRDKQRRRRYTAHVIIYRDAAGEHREKHSDRAAALARAEVIANSIANGQITLLTFTQADKASYQRAVELLRPTGKTLELAAAEYSAAIAALQRHAQAAAAAAAVVHSVHQVQPSPPTLTEAVAFFLRHQPAVSSARTCQAVFAELLEVRAKDGAAKNTLDDLRSRVGRFVKDFQCPISVLTGKDIDDWLQRLPVSRRTRNNYRGNLVDLVTFIHRRGYLPETWNPLLKVPRAKNEAIQVQVFTPEEIVGILGARQTLEARVERSGKPVHTLIPYLAIAAWAGCRHEELSSPGLPTLDWRHIDLEKMEIEVREEVARKIGHGRIVPISANLAAWLRPYVRPNGPICTLANTTNAMLRAAREAGVAWKDNGLRRSYISYTLALLEDIGVVARRAGTSPERIRHNYQKTLPKREADRWFDIWPQTADVVQLPLFACLPTFKPPGPPARIAAVPSGTLGKIG